MLDSDIALVTGASRGIGRAIAAALGAAGAMVIGTSTSAEGAAKFGAELAAAGQRGRGVVLDVGDAASIDALLAELEGRGELPTILVNNAAITRDTLLLRMKQDDWDRVISTNLTSTRISMSVKPRVCFTRASLAIQVPVADIGIDSLAARLAVGAERVQIVFAAARAREYILVVVAPGILVDALEIATRTPVAHLRIGGLLHERDQATVRAGVLEGVELVHRECGFERLDVLLRLDDLRVVDATEDLRGDECGEQADDDDHHHDLDEREAGVA